MDFSTLTARTNRTVMKTMADTFWEWGIAYRGVFNEAGKVESMFDGSIITTEPFLVVDEATASRFEENDSIITFRDVEYQITRKVSAERLDGVNGLVEMYLTRDF